MHPRLICAALLLSVTSANASTNVMIWTDTTNASCFIPLGCVGKLVSFNASLPGPAYPNPQAHATVSVTCTNPPVSLWIDYTQFATNKAKPVIVGPATIGIWEIYGGSAMATIEITCPDSSYAPSAGVVIPSDATGPVNIILESSCDMVNWTLANPGTYGSSATNRFFRVRALRL